MPSLIADLLEIADYTDIQAFFNARGYRLENDTVVCADGTLPDDLEVYELTREIECLYE